MKFFLAASLLFPAMAYAHIIPNGCALPAAHQLEEIAIPKLLDVDPSAAHIMRIDDLSPMLRAYQAGYGRRALSCYVRVIWSNGHVDNGLELTFTPDDYGQIRATLGGQ